MIPLLEAAPLRLVPFSDEHLSEDYIGWLNDPDVVRFSEQRHRRHTRKSCEAYIQACARAGNPLWAIEDCSAGNQHIGNISVSFDRANQLADIGILIGAPSGRGKGYGALAWGAVLEWLKTQPKLRKITGGCLAPNAAMVRIMQGAGMRPDGVRPGHFLVEGKPADIVYFASLGASAAEEQA